MADAISADLAATRSRESCGCVIVGESGLKALMMKYLGLKPGDLSNDEREILMFALYQESVNSGGLGFACTEIGNDRLKAQGKEGESAKVTDKELIDTKVPVECWRIPEANGLDQIQVFWLDAAPGKGYVAIICWGQAWTAYFNGMGDRTIRQFFAECDTSYMVSKMGVAPNLKQTKKGDAYLARLIDAVREAVKAEAAK